MSTDDNFNCSSTSSVPDAASMGDEDQSQSTTGTASGDKNEANAVVDSNTADDSEQQSKIFAEAKSIALKDEGNAALMAGKTLDAIRLYSEALEYAPTNAIILSNRAMAYVKVENYGLAIQDATSAIKADPAYAKGYYRRGTAEFALNKYKAARKDFKKVCTLKPKDKDARTRLAACDKAVKEAAFAAAIESEETIPLSESYDPSQLSIDVGYDGPHPAAGMAPMTDSEMDKEEELFQPGRLPVEFVMAAVERFKDQKLIHKRYVARLLINAKRHFEAMASLVEVPLPDVGPDEVTKPRVTVCGDTHGQFYDVMNIFEINGFPSKSNPYLFNGEWVQTIISICIYLYDICRSKWDFFLIDWEISTS